MSTKELKSLLETKFLGAYDEETNSFPAHLQEEYLTPEGWLDKAYICKNLKVHMSTATFRKVVKQVLPSVQFTLMPTQTELTKEEFAKHYTFGEFPNGRGWVGYMYGLTGKVARREDILEWVCSL